MPGYWPVWLLPRHEALIAHTCKFSDGRARLPASTLWRVALMFNIVALPEVVAMVVQAAAALALAELVVQVQQLGHSAATACAAAAAT